MKIQPSVTKKYKIRTPIRDTLLNVSQLLVRLPNVRAINVTLMSSDVLDDIEEVLFSIEAAKCAIRKGWKSVYVVYQPTKFNLVVENSSQAKITTGEYQGVNIETDEIYERYHLLNQGIVI